VASQHDAFLSYTRTDDEFHGGAITSLRKFIELGVQVVTGNRNFVIFQDVDGIEFGEQWQKRIDQAITDTSFLIPIITPLFFQSSACRDELEKFVEHERALARDDLILPIYFVTAPLLEKTELLKDDALASEIHKRHRYDWRSQADLPINDPKVRVAIRDLCEKIATVISRTTRADRVDRGESAQEVVMRDAAFQKASEAVKRGESAKGEKRNQWRVLWVDDRPDNNITERQAMEAYKIEFTLALSTGDALAKLRGSQFDAIISDMRRPPDPRAGYTLLEALRGSGDMTPYFIYTRSNDPKHLREAISRGAKGSTNNGSELIVAVLVSIAVERTAGLAVEGRQLFPNLGRTLK
jgi:CheY-like chemotaxis protein